ncbi:cytochrome c oxidase assembly factor 3, mitochondrial [Podospora conica]|nr:cytochrome c oxidase assembly factor 3, mitochondrial [Schizothecium conicum]
MSGGGIQRGSYYRDNRHSPALIRARRPYLIKNAVWGLGLFAFTGAIYMYTINAVGQDEFADVKVPDVPASKSTSDVQGQKN